MPGNDWWLPWQRGWDKGGDWWGRSSSPSINPSEQPLSSPDLRPLHLCRLPPSAVGSGCSSASQRLPALPAQVAHVREHAGAGAARVDWIWPICGSDSWEGESEPRGRRLADPTVAPSHLSVACG